MILHRKEGKSFIVCPLFPLFILFSMNTTLGEDNIIRYQDNSPKLQWLIVLIPVLSAFVAYSLFRIHNKRKKAQQLIIDQQSQQLPISNNHITMPSPTHQSSLFWQRFSIIEQDQRERRRRRRQRRHQQRQNDISPPAYSLSPSLPKYEDIIEPTQTH